MHKLGSSERPDWPLAVVVGAGGLGMAVARRLGLSHRILLADRNVGHAEQQCSRMRDEGHDAIAIRCDVTDREDVLALARQAESAGPVRTLAYVAGLSVAANDFRAIMSVNLVGAAVTASAFLDVLAPGGSAVFISSSSAHMRDLPSHLLPLLDDPQQPDFITRFERKLGDEAKPANAYWMSKAALNRMCRRDASPWGRRRLRIVSVSPGLIATPMGAAAYQASPGKHKLLAAVPLARECTMLEIANIVDFLASDAASFISGTDILVDGGMVAALQHPPENT